MQIENSDIKPIPLRVMVPLLEKASLADPGDQVLIDAWSHLLQSASEHQHANHGLFIDVLSKLDPAHLRFLDFLMNRSEESRVDGFMNIDRKEAERYLAETIDALVLDDITSSNLELFLSALDDALIEYFTENGCILLGGGIAFLNGDNNDPYYDLSAQLDLRAHPENLVDALAGVNIVERNTIHFESPRFEVWLVYVSLTVFGFEMYECCHQRRKFIEGDAPLPNDNGESHG